MKKETFIKAIESIQKQLEKDIKNSELLEQVFPDCYSANLLYDNFLIVNSLLEILAEEMKDKGGMIEWFCYETEFGNNSDKYKAYYENGDVIQLRNSEELYNFLKTNNF